MITGVNSLEQRLKKAVDLVKLDREGRHRYMTVEMWIREEAQIAAEKAAEKADLNRLISLVLKKVQRKKPFSVIVEELESDEEEIRPIYEAVLKYGADLPPEEIRQKMKKEQVLV